MFCCLLVLSLFFVTASSQDKDSVHCPISYLVSASDVLSNVGVSHHVSGSQSSASLEQDVVSFNSIWCDQPPAVGNNVTLNFSERVLINRIRVNGKQSAFVSNFTLLIQENSADTHNQFDRFSVANSSDVVFAIPNRTALSLRFHINSAVARGGTNGNQYCWHVNVFGCRLSEAVPAPLEDANILALMTSTSIQPAPSTLTATPSPSSSLPMSSCQQGTSINLAAAVAPLAVVIILLLAGTTVIIAALVVISYRKRASSKTTMKSVLEGSTSNSDVSGNSIPENSREGIKSPDGVYATIPELSPDLKTTDQTGQDDAIVLEMTDDFDIHIDSNPAYGSSPKLPPKNGHNRANGRTNSGSRFKKALSYVWLGRDHSTAVEAWAEEDKKELGRDSQLYI